MNASGSGVIVVTGATGLQGGAVVKHLLQAGWRVRALTRDPAGKRAAAVAALGAEVAQADMDDPASLRRAFAGAHGVYSVQNPMISGPEGEVRQGRNVADAAKLAGVQHLVYASTGVGGGRQGIPSWDSKLQVEEHMKALGLPVTILRPTAFMEIMTEKKFYPAMSTWHLMPAIMGSAQKVPWICADDLGAIAAKVFADPAAFVGKDLRLAADVRSIDECRVIYREVMSRNPPRFPMPPWLFRRMGFVGADLSAMWSWLRTAPVDVDPEATRAILPEAVDVRTWLSGRRALQPAAR